MTLKESCDLTYEECSALMAGKVPDVDDSMPRVKKQLLLVMRMRNLMPKVIVSYERIPYIYPCGNVRITFDKSISSSTQIEKFLDGDYQTRPILPVGTSILEVKWDEILPLHIKDVMQLNQLQWTAFSKYYMCICCDPLDCSMPGTPVIHYLPRFAQIHIESMKCFRKYL